MTTVRVMTYNIFRGGRNKSALGRLVRAAGPDVLMVNESPKTPLLWKRRCRELAGHWQLRLAGGGRDAGSNAVMVAETVEVEAISTLKLRTPMFNPRRGVVAAQLRVHGRSLGVVSCHLSLERSQRAKEVARILEVADTLHGPVIVAGDLNEPPRGPSWQRLRDAGYRDHGTNRWLTFPAAKPEKRIDALLVRGDADVVQHGDPGVPAQLQEEASDHRAVLAVLEI